ncbi:MAG: protein kinase [Myxococcota bacterium]
MSSSGTTGDLDGGFVDIARTASPHPVQIGPYRVIGLLGGGSMATIYVANRRCRFGFVQRNVIKRVNRNRPDAPMLQEMLLDEAQAMAFFDHPNLVALQDVGEDEDGVYLAMEYVDGTDLKRVNAKLRSRREALPFELACFITAEVLRGLHHAHTCTDGAGAPLEIVHRDVNPSNVLISQTGHVKLTDFGVVRMRERVQSKTEPGLVKGKYAYLAPEYIAGGPCSVRTDLYAAGVMLFELLTGRECYTGKSAYEVMWKIVNKGVPLYRLDREGAPEDLRRIVERATAMDPEQRYRSAQDMANAVEAWMVRNRRHATPWVLSVFFDRHGLLPGPEERPPAMPPLANLQEALPPAGEEAAKPEPARAPPMSPVELRELSSAGTQDIEPGLQASDAPARGAKARGFSVSTSRPGEDQWVDPTPTPIRAELEMRDEIAFSELTPMPELEEFPVDERLPEQVLDDNGARAPVAQDFEAGEPADATPETEGPEPSVELEVSMEPEDAPSQNELAQGLASSASSVDVPRTEAEEEEPPDPSTVRTAVGAVDDVSRSETRDVSPSDPGQHKTESAPVQFDPSNPPSSGKLEEIPAVELIDAYAANEASGVLEFRCGLIWKRVRLDKGKPTGITSNMGMELIGEHLVKARIISREELEEALEDSERSARSLTQTLLEQGALDRERLEVELGNNLSARLQEVLDWRWGTFEYHDRPVPSADILPRMDLRGLLDGARQKLSQAAESGRDGESSDALNPHKRLREALQVARSIASSSGKGRVDRPWRSGSDQN